jgi:hypothetical protein
MKRRILAFFVLATSAALCGCGGKNSSTLENRVAAALAITDSVRKDAQLAEIAHEAADARNGDLCKKALEGITDPARKDNVTASFAGKLDDSGDKKAAIEVAKLITDQARRDNVLSGLNK